MRVYDVEVLVRCRVEVDEETPPTLDQVREDTRYLVDDALAFVFNEAGFEHTELDDACTEITSVEVLKAEEVGN